MVGSVDISDPSAGTDSMSATVDEIISHYPDKTGLALNVLNEIQATYRYLPIPALEEVSKQTGIELETLKGMGEFFKALSLDPVGEYLIEVCDGTACHALGAPRLIGKFEELLGIKVGETTDDGRITLRAVHCVGACGIAPVVIGEGDVFGHVRVSDVSGIVDEYRGGEDE